MMLFVSGATKTVRRYADHPNLGRFTQPECGNDLAEFASCDMDKAADNNCLQGFNLDKYLGMCDALVGARRLKFVTAPDAVEMTPEGPRGNWPGTLWLFRRFAPALRARGLPVAIVAQDGAIVEDVPWDEIAALFIGGSTEWKLSYHVAYLTAAARHHAKHVHFGRVNSFDRLKDIRALHADSFDGGQFSMFSETYIPRYLNILARLDKDEPYRQETYQYAA